MYRVQTPAQMRSYLRSLRKSRGLTQRQLGERLGVSAMRISTIEKNPGSVALEQLLELVTALGARVYLDTEPADPKRPSATKSGGEW